MQGCLDAPSTPRLAGWLSGLHVGRKPDPRVDRKPGPRVHRNHDPRCRTQLVQMLPCGFTQMCAESQTRNANVAESQTRDAEPKGYLIKYSNVAFEVFASKCDPIHYVPCHTQCIFRTYQTVVFPLQRHTGDPHAKQHTSTNIMHAYMHQHTANTQPCTQPHCNITYRHQAAHSNTCHNPQTMHTCGQKRTNTKQHHHSTTMHSPAFTQQPPGIEHTSIQHRSAIPK